VQNRHLQADGRWQDGNLTRARITPVLDGTAPVAATTEEALFSKPWNAGSLSLDSEARRLDWLRGHWQGTKTGSQGGVRVAKLDATLLDKNCLQLSQLAGQRRRHTASNFSQ